jgi:hypothetical protein
MKLRPHHQFQQPDQPHLYTAGDLPADYRGEKLCRCGRPRVNDVHELPPVPQDVLDAEARRFGESTDD